MRLLIQNPPIILIISTYELLLPAILLKPFLKYNLVYDVQENYALNLLHNRSVKKIWKKTLAAVIRIVERISGFWIDRYFFAEDCYIREMPTKLPYTVLENKFHGEHVHRNPFSFQSKTGYEFLISGTLTEVYGILDGMLWFRKILEKFPDSNLQIIGHVPSPSFEKIIRKECEGIPAIRLTLSEVPIPYAKILDAYSGKDFVLMPYWQIPSISPKVPSKLFESIALGIPALFSPNPKWNNFVDLNQAGIGVDFRNLENAAATFIRILNMEFFTAPVTNHVLWKSEASRFLKSIEKLA